MDYGKAITKSIECPNQEWQSNCVEQDDQEWELCRLKLALEALYIHKVGIGSKGM